MRCIDLAGMRFTRWTVIDRDGTVDTVKGAYWYCVCDCGTKRVVDGALLRKGKSKSCGCMPRKLWGPSRDLSDQLMQNYRVIELLPERKNSEKWYWRCVCTLCGEEKEVAHFSLTTGKAKSCLSCAGLIRWRTTHARQGHEYLVQKKREREAVVRNNRRARKRNNGGRFSTSEWHDLCSHFNNMCCCCCKQLPLEPDHIIPVSKGGTSNIENIQPLCRSCNARKFDKMVDYRFI